MFTVQHEPKLKEQRGAIFVLTAVLGFMLLIVTALAVDFGTAYTQKEILQNAADAAALAGAEQLDQDITDSTIRNDITQNFVSKYTNLNIKDAAVANYYSAYDGTNKNIASNTYKTYTDTTIIKREYIFYDNYFYNFAEGVFLCSDRYKPC